jgi:TatD DNase family protein
MSEPNVEVTMETGAVDSHCHLFLLERPVADVLDEARRAGVSTVVVPGIDPVTSRRAVELASSFRGVFATAGMHPHDASRFDARAGAEIEELLTNPLVVGVGECGLDRFRMRSPFEDQERTLRAHVTLARDAGLPLVAHVRDAWDDILRALDEGSPDIVLHCFTGDAEIARECVRRGWFLSFAGNITYPANAHIRDAAAEIPLERILVETDSPFLSPQRVRGRENAPANVLDVLETIAGLRSESVSDVRGATSENARRAFPRLR